MPIWCDTLVTLRLALTLSNDFVAQTVLSSQERAGLLLLLSIDLVDKLLLLWLTRTAVLDMSSVI